MEPRCPRGWPGGAEASPREHHRPNDDGVEDFAIDDDLAIDDRDGGGEGNCDPATAYRPERRRRRSGGVVRALRILPENCRVLSSATRCPFLVRMEVVETGLDADDARLYVAGSSSSLTVQEALGSLRAPYGNPALSGDDDIGAMVGWLDGGDDAVGGAGGFPPCEIPPELMMTHGHRGGGGGLRYRDDAASSEVEDDAPSAARRDHRDDDDRVRPSVEPPPPPPGAGARARRSCLAAEAIIRAAEITGTTYRRRMHSTWSEDITTRSFTMTYVSSARASSTSRIHLSRWGQWGMSVYCYCSATLC
jgi:hypothetical protein